MPQFRSTILSFQPCGMSFLQTVKKRTKVTCIWRFQIGTNDFVFDEFSRMFLCFLFHINFFKYFFLEFWNASRTISVHKQSLRMVKQSTSKKELADKPYRKLIWILAAAMSCTLWIWWERRIEHLRFISLNRKSRNRDPYFILFIILNKIFKWPIWSEHHRSVDTLYIFLIDHDQTCQCLCGGQN